MGCGATELKVLADATELEQLMLTSKTSFISPKAKFRSS